MRPNSMEMKYRAGLSRAVLVVVAISLDDCLQAEPLLGRQHTMYLHEHAGALGTHFETRELERIGRSQQLALGGRAFLHQLRELSLRSIEIVFLCSDALHRRLINLVDLRRLLGRELELAAVLFVRPPPVSVWARIVRPRVARTRFGGPGRLRLRLRRSTGGALRALLLTQHGDGEEADKGGRQKSGSHASKPKYDGRIRVAYRLLDSG